MEKFPTNGPILKEIEPSFDSLPEKEREKLKRSWEAMEKMLGPEREVNLQETGLSSLGKIEFKDKESCMQECEEIYNFFTEQFEGEENADPMQLEIGIENNFTDNFLARDVSGKIACFFQTQTFEVPSTDANGRPELVMVNWYVATNPDYKGQPLTRHVFRMAGKHLLEKSKRELKPIKAFAGEAYDEVEGLYNRYGLERVYFKNKQGQTQEIPFECPPEDESEEGVPEHLMIRLLDGKKELTAKELMDVVEGMFSQYTLPEYFSVEYLKYAQEFYEEDLGVIEKNAPVTKITADLYRRHYANIVKKIKNKLEKTLNKETTDNLFLMSRRNRNKSQEE